MGSRASEGTEETFVRVEAARDLKRRTTSPESDPEKVADETWIIIPLSRIGAIWAARRSGAPNLIYRDDNAPQPSRKNLISKYLM
jgi:hypothetical protein